MISRVDTQVARTTGLFEGLNTNTLEEWQKARLCEVLCKARQNGRFYAKRLADVDVSTTLSLSLRNGLARLPFTSPADVAQDPLAFLCVPQRDVARVTTLSTSGTCGASKRIFFTQNDLDRTGDFFSCGLADMMEPGYHVLVLMSGETENSVASLIGRALAHIDVSASIGQANWSVDQIIEAARRADGIVGVPSQMLYLCRMDPSLRPKTVLLSADFAPLSVISAIEKTWCCEVRTHYGMTETGFGCAVQCHARDGHHVRAADVIVEVVDPRTGDIMNPGERGEIVVTTLGNEAMPLIRYRTGDMGSWIDGRCACGGILPRLGRVEGRLENLLEVAPGQSLSIHELDEQVFAVPGVLGYQAHLSLGETGKVLTLCVDSDRDDCEQSCLSWIGPGLPVGINAKVKRESILLSSFRLKRRIQT